VRYLSLVFWRIFLLLFSFPKAGLRPPSFYFSRGIFNEYIAHIHFVDSMQDKSSFRNSAIDRTPLA
jgi:hypothetical protein